MASVVFGCFHFLSLFPITRKRSADPATISYPKQGPASMTRSCCKLLPLRLCFAVGWNPRQFDMDQNPTSRTWSGKWKSSPFPFGVPGIKTLEPLPSSCGVHSSSHGYSGISIRIRFPYSSCMSISQIQCFDPVTFIYLRRFHVL